MIYLDNAATTGKKPISVIRAVDTALVKYCANPGRSGHKRSEMTAVKVYETREALADFFGASGPENVVFTQNCTHSLNCVIKGVLTGRDHVIVSSLEHNSVMRPLVKSGVPYDVAEVSLTDDTVTVNNFRDKIRDNTKMIICTGASNVLGKILPIAEIGSLCFEKGILFTVDAAQIAGIVDINMQKMHIDYLCIAPHKGLYAPMGIGALICEKPINDTIIEGGTGTESVNFAQPDMLPERVESGTINVPAILGISAGTEFVKMRGISNVYRHEMQLIKMLYDGLKNSKHCILYAPSPEADSYAPVLSFNVKGMTSGETAQLLDRYGIAVRAGLHCAPTAHRAIGTVDTGTVRVSPSVFNTKEEIAYLLRTVNSKPFIKK